MIGEVEREKDWGKEKRDLPDGAEVSRFRGFDGQFPSKHYAGYITLGNEGNGRYMYYYFATSERSPSEDPIVFWATGGPGCYECHYIRSCSGPFKIEEDSDYIINGVKVELNPFRWTKVSSLVVMDALVATEFSYSNNSEDYQTHDSKTIADIYDFVLKWLHEHPEFLSNPLYITGCSYTGAYVPTLSLEIVKESSRRDLHARPVEVARRWKRCSDRLNYRQEKICLIQHHLNLTWRGYRAFIYSGDHDIGAPYIGALEWIRRLNYTELESWRPWFIGHKIAGYTVQYEHNLLFATFKGAGHTVAEYTPHESLVAFQRWIDGANNL
ncbi:hypothetical protein AMTRI_Chr06g197870 [Amborella trichopoda]